MPLGVSCYTTVDCFFFRISISVTSGVPSFTPPRGLRDFCQLERAGVIGVMVLDVALNRRDAFVEGVENRVFEP